MSSGTPRRKDAGSASAATGSSSRTRPAGRAGDRQSVASVRQVRPGSNRTQLIIGTVAVALIAVVVVVGLVLNKVQNASPVTDHPRSTNSTASLSNGIITVTGGSPTLSIDLYEDGICPACQAFEGQYGQQMMKAVDDGRLSIRYHFLNFLNPNSASKDYSTRVAAAFDCVAAVPTSQAPKGLFMNFHTTMFSNGIQPAEGSTADLDNAHIADLAGKAGAPSSAGDCIRSGTNVAPAQTSAKAGEATLNQVIGSAWGTPTVLQNGRPMGINSKNWLTDLLR